MVKFNKNFFWGGATSAEQSEGNDGKKALTMYGEQFRLNKDQFYKHVGPQITSDVFNKFKEDVAIYKEIGMNSFRTSFSWARLFPDGMDKPASQEAVKFYNDYINECIDKGIAFFGTLFHFDLPMYEIEKGGWESEEVIDDFVKYADFIFKTFGDRIEYMSTMNEPLIPAINGYVNGRHYPNKKDFKAAINVGYGTILAHCKVVNLFNEKYKNGKNKIGGIFDARLSYAVSDKPEDIEAAKVSELFLYRSMTDSMILGTFDPELVKIIKDKNWVPELYSKKNNEIISKVKLDFYGVNFYAPLRVGKPAGNNEFEGLWEKRLIDNCRMNHHRGIEIYPKGLYDIIMDMDKRYKLPMYVSENGVGVESEWKYRADNGEIQDDYRIAFIKEHLEQVWNAIQEGVEVFGYHLWASIDCWSWINSYKNRYGFVEIQLENDNKRVIKKSGRWLKEFTKTNEFEKGYKVMEDFIDLSKESHEKSF